MITFAHMGHLHIVLEKLLTAMGQAVLAPPSISRRTLELGVRHSPETVCLPFKIMLGSFLEALDQGADTLLTCGGVGPCRLGCYAQVQKGILKQLGYHFRMLVVEPSVTDVIGLVRRLSQGKSWLEVYWAFRLAGTAMLALDDLEQRTAVLRPRELVAGHADVVRGQAVNAIRQACTIGEICSIWREATENLDRVPVNPEARPLQIGLVGEIFVMLEPFANQQVEKRLSNLGIQVHKTMQLSDYVQGHVLGQQKYRKLYQTLDELAKPYLGHYVGGHGLKSIAYTLHKGRQGLDGMIQVYPFMCMPEVIAKNILPTVRREADIPVLSLAYDEHAGEAGLVTRLEAFVDLLKYRRREMIGKGTISVL